MVEQITAVTWAQHNEFFALFFFLIALVVLGWRLYKTRKIASLLASNRLYKTMLPGYSVGKLCIKILLLALGVVCLSIAVLQPQWDKKEEEVQQEGRDLLIAFDVSRSMLARDVAPSRLACAKKKVHELVQRLDSERVGLILFSGSTFVQCPLTNDIDVFSLYLDALDAETIASGSTAIDKAIEEALRVFEKTGERKTKLLVIVTDGEDFSSNLAAVRQRAQQAGMVIFTLGIGTERGGPIPIVDENGNQKGHQLDAKGTVVISRRNDGILQSVADGCGGQYLVISPDDDKDVQALVRYVHSFEKDRYQQKGHDRLIHQYHYFLAVSFFCFCIEWLL